MERLTLEHLAPYLPYGLKVQYQGITNLQELADHNKKEPKGDFLSIGEEYEEWLKNTPSEKIGDRISVIKRIHFYKHHIRLYVGKRHGYLKLVSFNQIKPILRPLSDIDLKFFQDNIDPDLEDFRINCEPDKGHFSVEVCEKVLGWSALAYEEYVLFFKKRIDVFGLIAAGLAVDANNLEGGSTNG